MSDAAVPRPDEPLWAGPSRDDHDVAALREHLAANNGIVGLEVLDPHEIERACGSSTATGSSSCATS